ncbi:MAG: hypothetical protein IKF46_07440 [Erysipelotrichaceae bacterium]|nr:hypothetical protein [Erysipelotrichaceae bacterium]
MAVFRGTVYSASLRRNTNLNVIFPDHSNDVDPLFEDEPKVLYLLHGLGGSEEEWLRFSKIEYYAKKYNFIVILPAVERSFYCNTKNGIAYFDYVARELPQICSRWLNITPKRENTFIAGESMGGYGAVKIGLFYPQNYAGIASLSGVLNYEAFKRLVAEEEWTEMDISELELLHDELTPLQLALKAAADPERPKLIQMCGTEDFLYADNGIFREALEEKGYGHTYLEGPGDHEWPYWDKAVQYAFMFFRGLDLNTTRIY